MTSRPTEALIESLAAEAGPVRPLAAPLARATRLLLALSLLFAGLIATFGDPDALAARFAERELLMAAETAAMLATGVLAVLGAFALAVPGGSRKWLAAAGAAALTWLLLSSTGCFALVADRGADGWKMDGHADCLLFIVTAGAVIGAPLLWLLSRARPIDPAPVALLGGLGAAALSAFLLIFFHPFAVTVPDLGLHLAAVLIVITAAALLRRRALRPA
ncbi:NrsF family protein [Sphingosinicella sp. CPCC 101087]|uniref:NrsF family protein n=1 Tax=Sphingosinicella sp. CPCC 101087 TaxID=2497754 RepID=UPI0013EB87EC|nr:NrsF family protein [Sphingosinicella sp. CPCC 101087]